MITINIYDIIFSESYFDRGSGYDDNAAGNIFKNI